VSEIYVQLIEAERRGGFRLLEFQAEPASWRPFSGPSGGVVVKPDAYLRLETEAFDEHWFIEVDRSTETPSTLGRKSVPSDPVDSAQRAPLPGRGRCLRSPTG
jgi:hypothetical protein